MSLKIKLLFWMSLVYVILALGFWGKSLIDASEEINGLEKQILNSQSHKISSLVYQTQMDNLNLKLQRKKKQYWGEGSTFLLFILIGGGIMYWVLKREHKRNRWQKNFMLSITHELKTPIASVQLAMQTLKKQNVSPELKDEIIGAGLQELNRLNELTNNLLYVTRLESKSLKIQQTEFDGGAVLSKVVSRYSLQQPTHQLLMDADPFYFKGDEFIFELIISNLIDNAIKYSPLQNKVNINAKQSNDHVLITITDFGPGISEENQKHMFDKFYRIGNEDTRKTKGTGLGLYIVRKSCQLLNISIRYDYKNNSSIFSLTLPQ